MTDNIFKNYEAFYNMVLCTTMLSNSKTDAVIEDSKQIIRFIGKAYKMEDSSIDECSSMILDSLITLGLTTDQMAVYSSREYGCEFSDMDTLFDIKGDVLTKLQNIGKSENPDVNPTWFDYSHYKTYQANVRFAKISATAACGNLIAARQTGIMKALGIGCEKDVDNAIKRFTQCVFWGDVPSMFLLAYSYHISRDDKNSELFYSLADLSSKYLNMGYTVLPDDVAANYSDAVKTYYIYISSIKQDIVYSYSINNIDYSFLEVIMSDKVDYSKKMYYINNYKQKEWKDVTNSAFVPTKKLGFN
ncbi:MAG: hypothetical protein ACI4MO_02840 [Christensenellales bacterium]